MPIPGHNSSTQEPLSSQNTPDQEQQQYRQQEYKQQQQQQLPDQQQQTLQAVVRGLVPDNGALEQQQQLPLHPQTHQAQQVVTQQPASNVLQPQQLQPLKPQPQQQLQQQQQLPVNPSTTLLQRAAGAGSPRGAVLQPSPLKPAASGTVRYDSSSSSVATISSSTGRASYTGSLRSTADQALLQQTWQYIQPQQQQQPQASRWHKLQPCKVHPLHGNNNDRIVLQWQLL